MSLFWCQHKMNFTKHKEHPLRKFKKKYLIGERPRIMRIMGERPRIMRIMGERPRANVNSSFSLFTIVM